MAGLNRTQQILAKATLHDLGEISISQLIDRSNCSKSVADLGLIGDQYTLDRFLASRKETKLALPEQALPNYDLAGDFVDVGRFLSGEPECMFDYTAQYDSARFIDVNIRLGRPSRTENYRVFEYYGNVLHAIDILESMGLRCRITATLDCYHSGKYLRIVCSTPIKNYSEPINMAVFAGVVLNNRFFTEAFIGLIDKHFKQEMCSQCFCSDGGDLTVSQTENEITFPSLYFNNYSSAYSYPFEDYMKVIGLEHLLQK